VNDELQAEVLTLRQDVANLLSSNEAATAALDTHRWRNAEDELPPPNHEIECCNIETGECGVEVMSVESVDDYADYGDAWTHWRYHAGPTR